MDKEKENSHAALNAILPGDPADHIAADRHDLNPERRFPGQGTVPRDWCKRHDGPASKPWRADTVHSDAALAGQADAEVQPFPAGLRAVVGGHEPAVLPLAENHSAGNRRSPGIHRPAGTGAVVVTPFGGFRLDCSGGFRPVAAVAYRAKRCTAGSRRHGPGPGGWAVLGAVYRFRAKSRR